jgi:hypothetical protein
MQVRTAYLHLSRSRVFEPHEDLGIAHHRMRVFQGSEKGTNDNVCGRRIVLSAKMVKQKKMLMESRED